MKRSYKDGQTTGAASSTETENTDPYAQKLEISWIDRGTEIEDNNFVQKMIEEKFNVKLKTRRLTFMKQSRLT